MTAPPAALSAADRRLAALAATFAPDVAARIMSRLTGGELAATWGQALAALPRAERLAALAGALASLAEPVNLAAGQAVLDAGRPAVASALHRLVRGGAPWPGGVHPLLARAARELLAAAP